MLINDAKVGEETLLNGARLKHDSYSIEFFLGCLSFLNEKQIMYRYQLKGFDKFRSQPTYSSFVRYTNLSTGKYLFTAEAMNRELTTTISTSVSRAGIT